jgi:hypothetical protein
MFSDVVNYFKFSSPAAQLFPRLMRETCPQPAEALLFCIPAVQYFTPMMFCYGALKKQRNKE